MRIGTRFRSGAEPPASLPEAMRARVAEHDAAAEGAVGSWTLTYLENRPVLEHDDGTTLRMGMDGTVTRSHADDPVDDED